MPKRSTLNFRCYFLSAICLLAFAGCRKGPGEGGSSTIKGKVTAEYIDVFNNHYTYPAQKEDVYIIYGDGDFYGDNVETNYDGTYQFDYLKKGSYTVYAYSDCDTCLGGTHAELVKVEITENKSEVSADIDIVKQ
jgi:hypothetical protein